MDDILERIKEYALVIDSTLTDDDFLDFVVADVTDRAMAYLNRYQLVAQYEEDLDDDTVEAEDYELPIPTELERSLAMVVVRVHKTISLGVGEETGAISKVEDNNQAVTYDNSIQGYLGSQDDSEIFSSIKGLLDKFRIPNIVENT